MSNLNLTAHQALSRDGKIYFTAEELRCKGSGKLILAEGFGEHLLDLRIQFALPMKVTSACRSKEHNVAVRGAKNSFHICDTGRGCCAVDIATPNAAYRTQLVKLALQQGWSVGVNHTFVHLDRRSDYLSAAPVIFIY